MEKERRGSVFSFAYFTLFKSYNVSLKKYRIIKSDSDLSYLRFGLIPWLALIDRSHTQYEIFAKLDLIEIELLI